MAVASQYRVPLMSWMIVQAMHIMPAAANGLFIVSRKAKHVMPAVRKISPIFNSFLIFLLSVVYRIEIVDGPLYSSLGDRNVFVHQFDANKFKSF